MVFGLVFASLLAGSPIARTALPSASSSSSDDLGQVFALRDYRWVPVNVRRTPTTIECSFSVVTGDSSVHAELLSEEDFALFFRRREYETLAATPTGKAGEIRHVILTPGRYRVLIVNDRGAPPAAVSLVVRSEVDAPENVSGGVSSVRRLVVVLASLMFFSGTVVWSGNRLMRAYRNRVEIV